MIDSMYLYLSITVLIAIFVENVYLKRKIEKLNNKCAKWKSISCENRDKIIKSASGKAMSEHLNRVVDEERPIDVRHDGCFTSSPDDIINSEKYRSDVVAAKEIMRGKPKCSE